MDDFFIIPRETWGAKRGKGGKGRWKRSGEFVHTEAGNPVPSTGFSYEGFLERVLHIEDVAHKRGFNGISYTHVIDPIEGWIAEGRGWGQNGAHTVGFNWSFYAICFAGHGDKQGVSDRGWAAAEYVILDGVAVGALDLNYLIRGHREVARKSCPGNLIYPEIGRLRGLTIDPPIIPVEDDMARLVRDTEGRVYLVGGNTRTYINKPETLAWLEEEGVTEGIISSSEKVNMPTHVLRDAFPIEATDPQKDIA